MNRKTIVALAFAAILAGCLSAEQPRPTTSPDDPGAVAETVFSDPVEVTGPDGVGSEPNILATNDGALYVVSILGSAGARGDGLWKSTDQGATWRYLGKPDYPFGGGDADLDTDDAGTLYLPGQWRTLAVPPDAPSQAQGLPVPYVASGESMAVSKDGGATWDVFPSASYTPATDRQWTATYKAGHAWLAFNQQAAGLVVTHSTDSGATWLPPKSLDTGGAGIPSDWAVDRRDGTLYLPYGPGIGGGSQEHRLFVSKDGGQSFTSKVIHTSPDGEQAGAIFPSLVVDGEGTLYYAWSESVDQGKGGMRVRLITSGDAGQTWSEPSNITGAGTTAIFPWLAVGDSGHVAVSFYATEHDPAAGFLSDDAPDTAEWRAVVGVTRDALAPTPTWTFTDLSVKPNHIGPICTGGTGCDAQFRRLGDFFECTSTPDGRVAVVWIDDTDAVRTQYVSVQTVGSLRASQG